jgi:hypothetical protein
LLELCALFEALDEIGIKMSFDQLRHFFTRVTPVYFIDGQVQLFCLLPDVPRQLAVTRDNMMSALFGIAALGVDSVPELSPSLFRPALSPPLFTDGCMPTRRVCVTGMKLKEGTTEVDTCSSSKRVVRTDGR